MTTTAHGTSRETAGQTESAYCEHLLDHEYGYETTKVPLREQDLTFTQSVQQSGTGQI